MGIAPFGIIKEFWCVFYNIFIVISTLSGSKTKPLFLNFLFVCICLIYLCPYFYFHLLWNTVFSVKRKSLIYFLIQSKIFILNIKIKSIYVYWCDDLFNVILLCFPILIFLSLSLCACFFCFVFVGNSFQIYKVLYFYYKG